MNQKQSRVQIGALRDLKRDMGVRRNALLKVRVRQLDIFDTAVTTGI